MGGIFIWVLINEVAIFEMGGGGFTFMGGLINHYALISCEVFLG